VPDRRGRWEFCLSLWPDARVHFLALKQAPETVVLRVDKALRTVKINRLAKTVTLVDLKG
jgi:hypothetical protein